MGKNQAYQCQGKFLQGQGLKEQADVLLYRKSVQKSNPVHRDYGTNLERLFEKESENQIICLHIIMVEDRALWC